MRQRSPNSQRMGCKQKPTTSVRRYEGREGGFDCTANAKEWACMHRFKRAAYWVAIPAAKPARTLLPHPGKRFSHSLMSCDGQSQGIVPAPGLEPGVSALKERRVEPVAPCRLMTTMGCRRALGGTRTRTPFEVSHFECGASTYSATRAMYSRRDSDPHYAGFKPDDSTCWSTGAWATGDIAECAVAIMAFAGETGSHERPFGEVIASP